MSESLSLSLQAKQFHDLYIRINPKRIAFLKFIIEGYDGLALVTTVDRKDGLVRLLVPVARHDELWRLLEEIASDWQPVDPQSEP